MPANPAIPAPLSYDEENAAKLDGSLVYALCDSRSVVLSLHAAPFTPPLEHSCSPVRWFGATGEWFDSPVEDPAPSIYAVIDSAYDRGDSLAAILSLVGTSDEALRAIHSRLGTAMSTLRSMRDERSQDPAPLYDEWTSGGTLQRQLRVPPVSLVPPGEDPGMIARKAGRLHYDYDADGSQLEPRGRCR